MVEYPKVIHVGGIDVTVANAAEEARWRSAPAVSDTELASHASRPPAPSLQPAPVVPDVPRAPEHAKKSKHT